MFCSFYLEHSGVGQPIGSLGYVFGGWAFSRLQNASYITLSAGSTGIKCCATLVSLFRYVNLVSLPYFSHSLVASLALKPSFMQRTPELSFDSALASGE